jgi:hypothetical protein
MRECGGVLVTRVRQVKLFRVSASLHHNLTKSAVIVQHVRMHRKRILHGIPGVRMVEVAHLSG